MLYNVIGIIVALLSIGLIESVDFIYLLLGFNMGAFIFLWNRARYCHEGIADFFVLPVVYHLGLFILDMIILLILFFFSTNFREYYFIRIALFLFSGGFKTTSGFY